MIPILYAASETAYTSLGYGGLSDAISCEVRQEINGEYELFMQYPMGGAVAQYIAVGAVIKAAVDTDGTTQLFRVYRITKPISGIFGVYARHIFYDAAGVPVAPFSSGGAIGLRGAISEINSGKLISSPLSLDSDFNKFKLMLSQKPASLFSLMGVLLNVYGGEWTYDNFTATLVDRIGENRNAVIAYGKNLTTLEQDTNCADVYTGVLPFYSSGSVYISGGVVSAAGTYPVEKVLLVDFTDAFENVPTMANLVAAAQQYITDNGIGIPVVSLSVQFVDLSSTTEAVAGVEPIGLGDTVVVRFESLGVNATARVTSTVYNVLVDRYDSIHVGDAKTNIADTIVDQQAQINEKQNAIFKTNGGGEITQSIDGVTEWINPPLELGEEYRTIERYNGKPVYCKLVNFGSLPNETVKYIAHGISNIDDIVLVSGSAKNGSSVVYIPSATGDTYVNSSPYIVGLVWACGATETNVYIVTNANRTSWTGKILMKYTKTTD